MVSKMYITLFLGLVCSPLCIASPVAQMVGAQGAISNSSYARSNTSKAIRSGWVSEPQGRGTWSILLSCLITLSLCAWTAYHPNIPKRSRSVWSKFARRVKWLFMATLFPEAVVYCALAQLMAAKQLQHEVNKLGEAAAYGTTNTSHITPPHLCGRRPESCGYERQDSNTFSSIAHAKTWPEHRQIGLQARERKKSETAFSPWSLRQAFFANAGGLCVDSTTFHPQTRLAFNRNGILELAKAGILPNFNDDLMEDKSRADIFTKFLVCLQAGWFFAQFIGRTVQGLPVTLLELHTMSHVICAALIYGLWWYKPYDVIHPMIIDDQRVADMAAFFGQQPSLVEHEHADNVCTNRQLLTSEMVHSSHVLPMGTFGVFRSIFHFLFNQRSGKEVSDKYLKPVVRKAVVNELKIRRQVEMANRAIYRLRRHNLHIRFGIIDHEILGKYVCFEESYVSDEAGNLLESRSLGAESGSKTSRIAKLYQHRLISFGILFTLYGAFHLAAWSYVFPTSVEMWLWRGSAITLASAPISCAASFLSTAIWMKTWDALDDAKLVGSKTRFLWSIALVICTAFLFLLMAVTSGPLFAWLPARFILLGESFACLRSSVAGIYATTVWAEFFPHFS